MGPRRLPSDENPFPATADRGSAMTTMRLNALTVTQGLGPSVMEPPDVLERLRELVPIGVDISRRDAIKITGVATAVAYGAIAAKTMQPLSAPATGRTARVAWLRAGGHRAVLDPARFAGFPRLTVSSDGAWRATLSGATFPGTGLPAALDLATSGIGITTRLSIAMALGGFRTVVPLASWLAGECEASARVRFRGQRVDLGDGAAIVLDGTALGTLSPADWSLRIERPGIARVVGLGSELVADAVVISLASAEQPSLFSRRISRRSTIQLYRGGNEWTIDAPASGHGAVAFGGTGFDRLVVETAETVTGAIHRAVLADGEAAAGTYSSNGRGPKVTLPLEGIRFARLLGEGSYHVAGRIGAAPVWAAAKGTSLLVGGTEWSPPFSMQGGAGTATKVTATPAALGVSAPMGELLATPLTFPAEAQKVMGLGNVLGAASRSALSPLGIGTVTTPILLPDQTSLTITRPDDLLTLKFTFFNFAYVNATGQATLVRASTLRPAFIAVEFPPQHIIERVFFEGIQAPGQPPIQAFLADASRLAFRIPDSIADGGIPLTLVGLLDWDSYTHSVVPAAESSVSGPDINTQLRAPRAGSGRLAPETSLEVPWGLYMSPSPNEWWKHRVDPLVSASRTELWHTRLHGQRFGAGSQPPDDEEAAGREEYIAQPAPPGGYELPATLRAVWARYYDLRKPGMSNPAINQLRPYLQRNDFTTVGAGPYQTPPPGYQLAGFENRWAVVDLTARYHQSPMVMKHMMLSPLGAWFIGRGAWDIKNVMLEHEVATELEEWDHRATMGRDHWVKIVKAGVLFPFGHEASLITITERKFKYSPDRKRRYAYLMQRQYIKVKEPIKTFTDRNMPWRKVEIKTLMTPPITQAQFSTKYPVSKGFWPVTVATSAKTPFELEVLDWDSAGADRPTPIKLSAPLIFLPLGIAMGVASPTDGAPFVCATAGTVYQGVPLDMKGQRIAYAEKPAGLLPGDSDERSLPTETIYIGHTNILQPALGELRFLPRLYRARVRLETVEQITGSTSGVDIELSELYTQNGFGAPNDKGRVFAKFVTSNKPPFPGNLSGGLANPLPVLTGLSANKGAVGGSDLAQVGAGSFDPSTIFDVVNAELIGGITLLDLLKSVSGAALDNMPAFQQIANPQVPDEILIRYHWEMPFTDQVLVFKPGTNCKLILDAEMRKSLSNPAVPPSYYVKATLSDFSLLLIPSLECLEILFGSLVFESRDGATPDVTPGIIDVQFIGTLKYLAELAKYLGALGGAGGAALPAAPAGESGTGSETTAIEPVRSGANIIDAGPFKVDVDGSGLTASLNLGLPDLAIGVFSLTNMSIGAALKLPFNGDPVTLDFNFCTRESPFAIMVMGFGGGGYVLMQFDPQGMVMMEIGLEFGAGVSFGIGGIASGMVEIKGGLIIKYDRSMPSPSFLIFIRIHGELDILGIISISLTFYLELLYETFYKGGGGEGDKLTGTATLTIEIEILFITIPIELSVTKELAGQDPRFGDLMPVKSDWDTYCASFAPAQLGA